MDHKILSRLASFFFSTRLMAVLFLSYAIAMGAGTFIENDYNTATARIWIYNTWWFELIHLLFLVNFLGNIKRYQLYKKEKWATLILHLAFIFILIGAGITRYISYEGMMLIREGAKTNEFYSEKNYLTVSIDGQYKGGLKRKIKEKELLMSPVTNNDFSISDKFADIPYEVKYVKYIMNAKPEIKADKNGVLYLKMVEAGGGTRHEHFLKEGQVEEIHNLLFAFNKPTQGAINITGDASDLTIRTPFEGNFMRMADKMQGKVVRDSAQNLMLRSLYNVGGGQFVFPEPAIKGIEDYVSNNDYKDKETDDVLVVKVIAEGKEKEVALMSGITDPGKTKTFNSGNLEFTLSFGNKIYNTPFFVKLNDFIAEKYPGTEKSYSSFESKVTVLDTLDGSKEKFDARIFMNNVLDYKGFRFFQASYDPDEMGTRLSVNHDFWGTTITYIGYFMLFFGLMAIMFTKHSRFADLKRKLEKVKDKKARLLMLLVLFFGLTVNAQHEQRPPTQDEVNAILTKYKVSEAHASKFGRIVVQDVGGRMKPVNTFSSELLRKVSHSDTYNCMNADQVFLSMTQFPKLWYEVPIIYIKPGNDSIRKIIGIPAEQKFARFINFFDKNLNYKLSPYLDKAYGAVNPTQFEKDFVETDKKMNLMNSALSGTILRIFPVPGDKNNKWIASAELGMAHITGMDSVFTKQIVPIYLNSLATAAINKKYKEPDFYLDGISKYQKKYGARVMPSEDKISSEILYNKINIFRNLFFMYMTAGILMMIFVIIRIFKENKFMRILVNMMHVIVGLLFVTHTVGLIARWYISGHAPWSNAYEAIVYVAWATMFFGLAFDRKSKLTVAASAFVTSIILMAAYANWVDPEIANLQPVLNSYWLMIHVAVIVASYGPFALGMVLGFVSLLLILFTTEKNKEKMKLNIQEITYINEMSLTIGLVMLTIGNFLGGQWANESWGRYWGWDPKETWALISIMVYAFVIHARFVPALRGKWIFNLMSMFGFLSILFTYYGVNFHLTGLHSYASGEAKSLDWMWYSMIFIAVLGLITYSKQRKFYKK
ncbi:cytochrome c biogenesis protein [Flavobacterium pallidum]|uniref:Cytochrome C biogenesis protein n=1 Tax=Flavobacterium pallidum TaxID=2172098 RepID=A0A2S1SJN5_9FLAO|nr:cytochrome c biogenesis protein CcsA [Flavobacterium pallidum]AWI26557.1 cytochrome C biogenesis protein [Flavobacterium pallidum]